MRLSNDSEKRQGFTLIELMIVITVIAILITIAVVSFTRVQKQARDARRKAELRSISQAVQAYYVDNGSYPANGSALTTPVSYMASYPTPPAGGAAGATYTYTPSADGTSYVLCIGTETGAVGSTVWNVTGARNGGFATGVCAPAE